MITASPLTVFLTVLLLSADVAFGGASLKFSDGDFNSADWSYTVYQFGAGGSGTETQQSAGGNPGAFEDILININPGGSLSAPATVYVFGAKAGATFNPQTQGAITSLDYSEDGKAIQSQPLAGPALVQNGKLYAFGYYNPDTNWSTHAMSGITVSMFYSATDNTTPDFSTNGAPIQFGFMRENASHAASGVTTEGGIDNWSLTVNYSPPSSGTASPQNRDANWLTPFSPPGVGNGQVYAIAATTNHLYVGGVFSTNNGNAGVANYMAQWDTSGWSSLGAGIDGNGSLVSAISVVGSNVYVAGTFNSASGVAATNIARWDAAQWHAVGTGIQGVGSFGVGVVRALATDGTNLYVGGSFTSAGGVAATNIAKWDGTQWSAVGAGLDSAVNALAYANGRLYVGGVFTHAGAVQVIGVAQWDGSAWSDLGVGVHGGFGAVSAIAVDGNNVYVGGQFSNAGGTNNVFGGLSGGLSVANLARWDGQQWSALGGGISGGFTTPFGFSQPAVTALVVQNGNLFVGGQFTQAGSVGATNVARWDGTSWFALGTGVVYNPNSFTTPIIFALAAQNGSLYVGGQFNAVGNLTSSAGIGNLARWDGTAWSTVGFGFSGVFPSPTFAVQTSVDAIVTGTDAWYVGGNFTNAAGISANGIVSGGLTGWTALGTGLDNRVRAIARSGTNLYAGGDFLNAGGNAASHVALWNGANWAALGSGVNGSVYALTANGADLYAGGSFTTAGGVTVNHIGHWDGNAWSALDTGLNGTVYALIGGGTNLYAGGQFSLAGSVAVNSVARWDGTQWSALGKGLRVSDLVGASPAVVHGLSLQANPLQLYAAGLFLLAGDTNANYVARWDGAQWSPLGSGISSSSSFGPTVSSVLVAGNDVYVGGSFDAAGGTNVHNVARWDGTQWNPLGSGAVLIGSGGFIGGSVNALGLASGPAGAQTMIGVGGSFSSAGLRPSANFAVWEAGGIQEPPKFEIQLSGHAVIISGIGFTGTNLETTTNLSTKPVQWTPVSTTPGAPSITLPISNAQGFYRLRE